MPPNQTLIEAPVQKAPLRKASLKSGLRSSYRSGSLATVLVFLPPALLLFTLFVILPVGEASFFSFLTGTATAHLTNGLISKIISESLMIRSFAYHSRTTC
jgi:ABC-type sugar transport system permease subunit